MLTKRIIPCLDVKEGRTVKGVNFEQLRDAGDPVELSLLYAQQGADELVFLDISATHERRKTQLQWVEQVAAQLNIPFTVGGGINALEDVSKLLRAGVDKVSVNSAAIRNPDLVDAIASEFGSQCLTIAIDSHQLSERNVVHVNGGREKTEKETITWAKEVADRGAGEILLTSMDHDGTKGGFANTLTAAVSEAVSIPVIASGGAGQMEDFKTVFTKGKADAALAASIFHFKEIEIPTLKKYLDQEGIAIRI